MTEPEIITLGCRLNTYESEVMRGHATAAGLGDAVIVNTCAVTGEAVRQAAQTIRRLRRERPETRIIVTGCAAQIDPDRFADMAEVDHVIGNREKTAAETYRVLAGSSAARVSVDDIMNVHQASVNMIGAFHGRVRAYVEVQNGCDHRCTFCIIPFGRGPSRSVPAGQVVAQIRRLVEAGCREAVLTGVDMTSYGADLPGQPTVGRLVRQILRHVPDLKRLRLSSIDQVEVDRHLLDAIANEDRLMPHLHLSMQSGDAMILKRMKRRHTPDDAIGFCETARRLRPGMVFGADLIAGFPTETDAMFDNTLGIVEACGVTYVHAFPFSARDGTPAARMPQVPKPVVKQRADRLRALGQARLTKYLCDQQGLTATVLIEGSGQGRTPHFAPVDLAGPRQPAGMLVDVRMTGMARDRLHAVLDRFDPEPPSLLDSPSKQGLGTGA